MNCGQNRASLDDIEAVYVRANQMEALSRKLLRASRRMKNSVLDAYFMTMHEMKKRRREEVREEEREEEKKLEAEESSSASDTDE
jgi:hypothetical protein